MKIGKVIKNSYADIEAYNLFNTHNYLAQDYLFLAIEKKDSSIVEKAFKLLPNSIAIQKLAVDYNLKSKRKTTTPIVTEVINDNVAVLVPSDTQIPASGKKNFATAEDNQESAEVTVKFGHNEKASKNKLIGSFNIAGIPEMKKGEAKLITKWSISLDG